MTLQECYVKIGGDYNDILHRFMNENMVRKFVLKFPQDNNMALFEESWAKKDLSLIHISEPTRPY